MKKSIKVLIIVIAILALCMGTLMYIGRPLSKEDTITSIQKHLDKTIRDSVQISSIILTIYSETKDYNHTFVSGTTGTENRQVAPTDRYHSASIGKTFTATIFGMLYEKGKLDYSDRITDYLSDEILKGLFIYQGVDYKDEVTIMHLLKHTSGVADFFEDPVIKGKPMLELIQDEPDRIWSPLELVAFSRQFQTAVNKPGEQMHYSDTGYVLLGLILEEATGMEYHEALHDMIFEPLDMNNSYLNFKSESQAQSEEDILEIWIDGTDFSQKNALSLDWAGGGIVSTTQDLLTFFKALHNGELVKDSTFNQMKQFNNEYRTGVYYGMGMMEFDFGDFSFFLEDLSNIYGGVGATGSFMMYDETNDTYIIANYGSFEFMDDSVESLANILMIYDRMEP